MKRYLDGRRRGWDCVDADSRRSKRGRDHAAVLERAEIGPGGARSAIREGVRPQAQDRIRLDRPVEGPDREGPAFDVAILGVEAIDDLIKRGKLAAGSRTDIARSGMGVAVRKGAAKPDLATTQAFKQALLNAQTIAYSDGGLTGIYLKGLLERLGIAEQLKSKIRFGRGAEMVGEGKAEIGLTQVSEILPVAGAELAGPLPPEIQQYTVFPAAIGAAAAQAEAGQALLKFLKSPDAAKVLKAEGAWSRRS